MTYLVLGNNTETLLNEVAVLVRELGEYGEIDFADAEKMVHPDLHIFNGFAADGALGITDMRQFAKRLHKKPFKAKVQLGIILGFEKATVEAQNAMLKEFEDHASTVAYILAVVDESSLLATIKSRTTARYAGGQQNHAADKDIGAIAAQFTDKKIDTVTVFAQIYKKEWTKNQAEQVLSAIYRSIPTNKKSYAILQKCSEFLANNVSPKQVLGYLLFSLRSE